MILHDFTPQSAVLYYSSQVKLLFFIAHIKTVRVNCCVSTIKQPADELFAEGQSVSGYRNSWSQSGGDEGRSIDTRCLCGAARHWSARLLFSPCFGSNTVGFRRTPRVVQMALVISSRKSLSFALLLSPISSLSLSSFALPFSIVVARRSNYRLVFCLLLLFVLVCEYCTVIAFKL